MNVNPVKFHCFTLKVMQQFSPRDPCKIPSKDIPKVEDMQGSVATSKDSVGMTDMSLNLHYNIITHVSQYLLCK